MQVEADVLPAMALLLEGGVVAPEEDPVLLVSQAWSLSWSFQPEV